MKSLSDISVIIAAAGKGSRTGFSKNKLLVPINGEIPLLKTVSAFDRKDVAEIIICANKNDLNEFEKLFENNKKIKFSEGGETRFNSIKQALKKINGKIALIHDGARPFVSQKIIDGCIESVNLYGSGIAAVPAKDSLCESENGKIIKTLERKTIYNIQTPQGFLTEEILKAYGQADEKKEWTDDSSVYLAYIGTPTICSGHETNIKLTYKEDYIDSMNHYTGIGFDTHRLVKDRKLILGGVEIESALGLLGHSDADVLTHAVMDALLSSAGLRDIGFHFSDSDEQYKDISSLLLLEKVMHMLEEKNLKVQNVSAVIVAQTPKLSPFIDKMKENLAKVMHISTECVGITATTSENLGYTGRSEGISVTASCLIKSF